jgi:subtilase family serine protease
MYANTTYGVANSSQMVYFTVSLPKPDLIIEDVWTSGNTINYRIKNQGNANAGSSYSKLYIDDNYKVDDNVPLLASLTSSNEYFPYSWLCSGSSDTIKVCADGNNNVVESNENNNCFTKTVTCPVTTTIPCTCTSWVASDTCCYARTGYTQKYIRTCNPRGCQVESKCQGYCVL